MELTSLANAVVTVTTNFWTPSEVKYHPLEEVIGWIKSGRDWPKIKEIRENPLDTERDSLKKQLYCICFSGEFSYREDVSLVVHSGLVILDFDDVENPGAYRDTFRTDPYCVAAFISPSGTGVKVLYRIPPVPRGHRGHYAALVKKFPELDTTNRNESRICFMAADSKIYYNPLAQEYTEYEYPAEVKRQSKPANFVERKDPTVLNKAIAMIRNSHDGNRHHMLMKAANLAGGHVGAGSVDEQVAFDAIRDEFSQTPYDIGKYNLDKNIRDGMINGMKYPIYLISDTQETIQSDGTIKEEATPVDASTHDFVMVSDVWNTMMDEYENGKERGTTTYFTGDGIGLDELWSWMKGEETVVSGRPGEGKTMTLKQLMLAKSLKDGTRWGVFAPENWPASEYFEDLAFTLTGLPAELGKRNRLTVEQYHEAMTFINNHFFYADLKTKRNLSQLQATFKYGIEELGVEGFVRDPFNKLTLDSKFTRDDQIVSEYLDTVMDFAQYYKVYDITVVHPAGSKIRRLENGEYAAVDYYGLAGGGMWGNKMDNFWTTYRPMRQRNPKDPLMNFTTGKIRRSHLVGKEGTVEMQYDWTTNRIYVDGKSPLENLDNPFDLISRSPMGRKAFPAVKAKKNDMSEDPFIDPFKGVNGIDSFYNPDNTEKDD